MFARRLKIKPSAQHLELSYYLQKSFRLKVTLFGTLIQDCMDLMLSVGACVCLFTDTPHPCYWEDEA